MKRIIAIALIGTFSLLMVGTVYFSCDSKESITLVKKVSDNCDLHFIHDGFTPSVEPHYGKMVTVLSEDETLSGYTLDIAPSANDPPTIRML
ncbi:hypothetical protein [Sphingobacterium yanglingense]|uniref:Uncharacterized protein n=1 Tax=Sphingobacterium yanglingense TaxID=1437280 RepID=A0A4R6WSA3_9SPHI|nr:hypothetical protein [Sphingobacterium yanglingense]TDQ79566.1 hypothetical protein CLV99_1010 [Sphingobacterium yanglingense]